MSRSEVEWRGQHGVELHELRDGRRGCAVELAVLMWTAES